MINFTVGPVQMNEAVCTVGGQQIPYFRTPEFSEIMKENERFFLNAVRADKDARAVFLTGSGTAGMEAAIMHTLSSEDKVLVVNGGSFGHRFTELCALHEIPYTAIELMPGKTLHEEQLRPYANQGYTAFVVNVHETSTGVHYNLDMIHQFCEENGLFLIVDAISSFLADEVDMKKWKIDVLIVGSQKALAVPPGISILGLSKRAVERINKIETKCMYLDLKSALKNAERGQTPYTPAVGTLLQIHERLSEIEVSGVENEIQKVKAIAEDFRSKIQGLPLTYFSESMSNAVTALETKDVSAKKIFDILKDEYQIWVCPNGGALADKVFRVGHIGNLTLEDNKILADALWDLKEREILI